MPAEHNKRVMEGLAAARSNPAEGLHFGYHPDWGRPQEDPENVSLRILYGLRAIFNEEVAAAGLDQLKTETGDVSFEGWIVPSPGDACLTDVVFKVVMPDGGIKSLFARKGSFERE